MLIFAFQNVQKEEFWQFWAAKICPNLQIVNIKIGQNQKIANHIKGMFRSRALIEKQKCQETLPHLPSSMLPMKEKNHLD